MSRWKVVRPTIKLLVCYFRKRSHRRRRRQRWIWEMRSETKQADLWRTADLWRKERSLEKKTIELNVRNTDLDKFRRRLLKNILFLEDRDKGERITHRQSWATQQWQYTRRQQRSKRRSILQPWCTWGDRSHQQPAGRMWRSATRRGTSGSSWSPRWPGRRWRSEFLHLKYPN